MSDNPQIIRRLRSLADRCLELSHQCKDQSVAKSLAKLAGNYLEQAIELDHARPVKNRSSQPEAN